MNLEKESSYAFVADLFFKTELKWLVLVIMI